MKESFDKTCYRCGQDSITVIKPTKYYCKKCGWVVCGAKKIVELTT